MKKKKPEGPWKAALRDILRDFRHKNEYELMPYLVEDGEKHPVAVICPGGGYNVVCSFVEGEPFARALNKMGICAVVVYYHTREQARFPGPQDDLARAVKEVLSKAEEWNLDVSNYSVWGSSAGGHLAASFGTETMGFAKYGLPAPHTMVLVYPVITLGDNTHEGTRNNLLGKEASSEEIAARSIHLNVTQRYPRTFLWCGDADRTVPPVNSHMMEQALKEKGVEVRFLEYPGVDHGVGLGIGTAANGWLGEAVKFWLGETVDS